MARAAEWKRRVARWRASGESAAVFGRRQGWHPRTLTWWASRLRRGAVRVPPDTKSVALVRILAAPKLAAPIGTPIELVLAGGRVLRVGRDFEVDVLRALVDALEVPW